MFIHIHIYIYIYMYVYIYIYIYICKYTILQGACTHHPARPHGRIRRAQTCRYCTYEQVEACFRFTQTIIMT